MHHTVRGVSTPVECSCQLFLSRPSHVCVLVRECMASVNAVRSNVSNSGKYSPVWHAVAGVRSVAVLEGVQAAARAAVTIGQADAHDARRVRRHAAAQDTRLQHQSRYLRQKETRSPDNS